MRQAPSACPVGVYPLYAKFYAPWGTTSDVVSDSIALTEPDQTLQRPTHPTSAPTKNRLSKPFTANLKLGDVSNDVKRLQMFLNQNPDTQIAKTGIGSPGRETTTYGLLTKAAVKKFQEKYAADILIPLGLKKGTGACAQATRSKMNKLLGW
jgi:peptidoglycan hydrolase-like protein with peptidoglycan-binding domain